MSKRRGQMNEEEDSSSSDALLLDTQGEVVPGLFRSSFVAEFKRSSVRNMLWSKQSKKP